ncbi:transcriptional regulator ERG homolog [Ptychodera flava]|uniref:transcriptional regulator ERG homolog n=1 Tax=Ptychodera flava TaxID=63121 RepID=UPI003969F587
MSTTSPVSRCVEKMPFYSDFNMSSVVGHLDGTQSRSHSDQPPINAYTMAINQNLVTNTKEPVESQPPRRKRGRPPKPKPPEALKPKKSHPILWKFLLESLNDSTEPRRVTWVNKEDGVFRFVGNRKEEIAKQWGERKGNRKVMTYQKKARALRHHGKKEIIKKHRRRLHYKFHPKCLSKAATLSAKIARESDHSKPTDRSSVITDSHPSPEKLLQSSHTASHVMAYSRDEMIDIDQNA